MVDQTESGGVEKQSTEAKLDKQPLFIRLLLAALFAVIFFLLTYVVYILAAWQALANLFIGSPNQNLIEFGAVLRNYLTQILEYLTFNSNEPPFPFAKWPSGKSIEL